MKTQTEPMTLDQVRKAAPAVFAEGAHESRSAKYTHISTISVLEGLMAAGWMPHSARQNGTRFEERLGFRKHQLRLRHVSQTAPLFGELYPEVVLSNSHDGGSVWRIHAGLFREICKNGLIAAIGTFESLKIRHMGNVLPEVLAGCNRVAEVMPKLTGQVEVWMNKTLTPQRQIAFAKAALALRFGEDADVKPKDILVTRRPEDAGRSLWATLNVCQENLLQAGVAYQVVGADGQPIARATRGIARLGADMRINQGLWALAMKFAN